MNFQIYSIWILRLEIKVKEVKDVDDFDKIRQWTYFINVHLSAKIVASTPADCSRDNSDYFSDVIKQFVVM